jgi:hypothetical protein
MIADELKGCTAHEIVTQDLDMRKLCAKMVPNETSAEMLERLKTGPDRFIRVITGGESWFIEYDPETKRHTPQSPRQKKAPISKYKLLCSQERSIGSYPERDQSSQYHPILFL